MPIIDILSNTFLVVYVIYSIVLSFQYKEEKTKQLKTVDSIDKTEQSKAKKFKNIYITILNFAVVIAFLVAIFKLLFSCKSNFQLLFVIIFSPVYLKPVFDACFAADVVNNLLKSKDDRRISLNERVAINTLAYAIVILKLYKIPDRFMDLFLRVENNILFDVLILFYYIVAFFVYIFLLCSLISNIVFYFIKIINKMYAKFINKDKIFKCEQYIINKIYKIKNMSCLGELIFDSVTKKCKFKKILIYSFLLPIVFLVDFIISILICFEIFILFTIQYGFTFFRMLGRKVKQYVKKILIISEKQIVIYSFRIAFIVALLLVVILNRYQPFLRQYNESTTVLEFVASTIIIPVIFKWIYSLENKKLHRQ